MARRAFTLIEVLAVVALMALLAGATVYAMAEDVRRSSREEVVGRLAHADHMARLAAERLGEPVTLRFDLRGQRALRVVGGEGSGRQTSTVLALPPGYRIDRIVMAAAVVDSGDATVAFSTGGRSASYGVCLISRDDGAEGKTRQDWFVFAGLTGQMTVGLNDDQVDNLFAAVEGGADAH